MNTGTRTLKELERNPLLEEGTEDKCVDHKFIGVNPIYLYRPFSRSFLALPPDDRLMDFVIRNRKHKCLFNTKD